MNHTNALYFTVTVFATVGFGDITAQTATARLLVTGQMITDLIILGLGARVIVGAVTCGRRRLPQDAGTAPPGKDPPDGRRAHRTPARGAAHPLAGLHPAEYEPVVHPSPAVATRC